MGPSQAEVDTNYARLTACLRIVAERLRLEGNDFWADWVADSLGQIEARNATGLRHFRDAFGGMGSLNDVLLDPTTEQTLSEAYALTEWFGRHLQSETDWYRWVGR